MREVPDPTPGDDEVLVRVRAASINAADAHVLHGDPWPVRFMIGFPRPKVLVFGADIAGVIEAVGSNVSTLRAGDAVFGAVTVQGRGGLGELAVAPARLLAKKPTRASFEEAACLGIGATTALQAARDWAPARPGQRVLVNGAAGGVGHFLVQIAKARGARVTGVCRTPHADLVRSLGADEIVDRTRVDFRQGSAKYDIIYDAAAYTSVRETARALAPGGTLAFIGGANGPTFQAMLLGWALVRGEGRRLLVKLSMENGDDEREIAAMVEAGTLRAVIDRTYPLARAADAMRHFETARGPGKVVVTI